jgi:hypothetical protein
MQIVSVSGAVDEEQGIRNDGIKSSRSHRALEQSGIRTVLKLLGKKRQLSLTRLFSSKH